MGDFVKRELGFFYHEVEKVEKVFRVVLRFGDFFADFVRIVSILLANSCPA
jgi:hypothetical protein